MDDKNDLMKLAGYIINKTSREDLRLIMDAFKTRAVNGKVKDPFKDHRLAGRSELKWAVDYIARKLSPVDMEIVKGAIERRIDRNSAPSMKPAGGGPINPMASGIINSLQRQMEGIAGTVRKTARLAAAEIILSSVPNIPDKHLEILLEQWVPASETYRMGKEIPPEMMYAMVDQFITYSLGKYTEDELKDFPEGWATKYWGIFPEYIKRYIGLFLYNKIEGDLFWDKISSYLGIKT